MVKKVNKWNYLEEWLQQHRNLSYFIIYFDGLLDEEAGTTLK